MGRAERRRLEKQKGKQVKTYNLTRSQLHNAVRQVTEEDLKRIKQEAMEDAINTAMTLGHIEITGKRNGKTDEEIAEIVDKTIKDIISGMAGVELEEIKEGNGYTEVHITGNANPIEVREYIERELKDRLAMVL